MWHWEGEKNEKRRRRRLVVVVGIVFLLWYIQGGAAGKKTLSKNGHSPLSSTISIYILYDYISKGCTTQCVRHPPASLTSQASSYTFFGSFSSTAPLFFLPTISIEAIQQQQGGTDILCCAKNRLHHPRLSRSREMYYIHYISKGSKGWLAAWT